ncbi:hypothetical protein CRUP_009559, partial [Coryphaenoides rupestris]
VRTELDQIAARLQEDGLAPAAGVEEQQRHLWRELNQSKELAELLSQEGLGDVGLSSPSEQVAYLLVERATLLERLESAERRLDTQSLTGNLREVHLQLHQEEVSQERGERRGLERDLDEASRRLSMAHQDIRRLTGELDAARQSLHHDDSSLGLSGAELERTEQEVENLRKEVDKLKHCDMVELQRAKDHNERLDGEIRVLRERVRTLDTEKKTLLEKLAQQQEPERASAVKPEEQADVGRSGEFQSNVAPLWNEEEHVHKRCREAVEDGRVQLRELQRRLQRQRSEQEELVERNEELEALLGEAQNASKEERQRHDGELEGLRRKVELKKQFAQDKVLKNGEESKESEPYFQPLRGVASSSQERVSLLEARLTEEKDWRKQLEVDLTSAQAALKKDKEALQIGERELKKLRLEVKSLQTECQQGKTLIKSLTQVKGEKAVLEEKLAQLERAHSRLQTQLDRHKESSGAKEDLRESRVEVEQLRGQTEHLTSDLSSLRTAHDTL